MTDEADPSAWQARTRVIGLVVLAVLLVAGLAWLAVDERLGDTAAAAPAPVESLAHPSLVEMLASVDATRLGAQAASAVEATRHAPIALAADEAEVCGVGRVKADATGQPKDMHHIRLASRRLRAIVLPALLNSTDDHARGAGLLMQSLGDESPGDGVDAVSARARDELASLAAFKGSPQLYAWAMRACQRQRGEGVCRMLSAEQWARIEPGNAMAWLHVASDAHARGDTAAVAEAMYRVSTAPTSDARTGSLFAAVFPKLPAGADLLARASFGMDVSKVDARAEMPLVAANQYCGANEVRDANRHQVCAAVAEVLGKRGSTAAEAAWSAAVGERVGWPAERLAALADERDAMAQLNLQTPAPEGAWGCDALARNLSQLVAIGQQGEVAALRAALKQSGESAAVLATRYRLSVATRVATAASAASAASPTP